MFEFRKSSYSGGGSPEHECVEIATNVPTSVAVRDSKDPRRGRLRMSPTAWAAFLAGVRHLTEP
jgi:hypothetical protein